MVKFSLPATQFLTSFTSGLSESKDHNDGFIYTLIEGEIPSVDWFSQFEEPPLATIVSRYTDEFEGRVVAYIRFRSDVNRSDILKGKLAVHASVGTSFFYDFISEGTPNWFMLSKFPGSNTYNNIPYYTAIGQVGADKDIQLTKSPLTEYSEVSISDILISNVE